MAPARVIDAAARCGIFPPVSHLTRQEQIVLCLVLSLLLAGWAVKACRAAPASAQVAERVELEHARSQF